MKSAHFISAIIVTCSVGGYPCLAQTPGDDYFDSPIVHDIYINFFEPNWYDTLAQYKWMSDNLDSTIYLPATVDIDGIELDSVGVRFKGNSSYYNYPTVKKPFKLDFNRFVSGQVFNGLKKMNLNNMYQDPTFMREKMFLDFIQGHDLYGPRAAYSRLYVNGEYYGLYLSVDQIDKTFLQWNFGNDNANLFKGDGSSSSCANLEYHGTLNGYYNCYELKTNEVTNDWSDLVDLTAQINLTSDAEFRDSVEAKMNTASFLGAWACYNLFADFDSYPYRFSHNYYTYHNSVTDKFEWIVWDVSTAFGTDIPWSVSDIENASIYFIWPEETERPLSYRMLQDSIYTQAYTNLICEYMPDFDPAVQHPIIDSLYAAILTDVYADNLKMYSNAQFENNINAIVNINGADYPGLKPFIENRYMSVQAELSTLSCAPLSVNELHAMMDNVLLFPNPTVGELNIDFGDLQASQLDVSIFNSLGQLVYSKVYFNVVGGKDTYPITQLASGLYYLALQDLSGNRVVKKFIK